jgi:predicted dinucleotide-binding enzyme
MTIGIIGAGHIGSALTRRLQTLGHKVRIANSRGPETLSALVEETGATAVTAEEAVRGADIIVVTIPERAIPDLPKALFADVAANVPVVDTGNYYPKRDGRIAAIESGTTESRWVADQLGRSVIKAFNNIYAQHIVDKGLAPDTPGRIALPIAGDDNAAKKTIMDLVDQLGFDAVDAGTLDESWRQQPGSPVYGTDFDAAGVRRALAQASSTRTPDWIA